MPEAKEGIVDFLGSFSLPRGEEGGQKTDQNGPGLPGLTNVEVIKHILKGSWDQLVAAALTHLVQLFL